MNKDKNPVLITKDSYGRIHSTVYNDGSKTIKNYYGSTGKLKSVTCIDSNGTKSIIRFDKDGNII